MRKYLKDIGVRDDDIPENWGADDKNSERRDLWAKQREEYGFDERETWSFDKSLYMFVYERLMMYNEVNILDTTFHKQMHRGVEITFQEAIDRMIHLSKVLILDKGEVRNAKKIELFGEELFDLLKDWRYHLWW